MQDYNRRSIFLRSSGLSHAQNTASESTLLLDGGLGTELARRGCHVSDALWSARALLEDPAAVERVHLDYLEAGADVITTASYQVSFAGFARAGVSRANTVAALHESVAVARRAREKHLARAGAARAILVAASVGPYGATLADGSEFHGNYDLSFDALVAFHRERLEVLAGAGADLLACETLPSLDEAKAILAALGGFPGARAWFSFTCADEKHTAHGEAIGECARLLDGEEAVAAIGINCTAPPLVTGLIREMRGATRKPVVVYPNRGQKWDAVHRRWIGRAAPQDFGALAREWHAAGARWIGGCCGTTPQDIAAMRAALA